MYVDLLLEGVRLMVIGMGVVYLFLLLLVAIVQLLPLVVARFERNALRASIGGDTAVSPGVPVAVIAAALARYRRDHPAAGT